MKTIRKLIIATSMGPLLISSNALALTQKQLRFPYYSDETSCSTSVDPNDIVTLKKLYVLGDSITDMSKEVLSAEISRAGLSVVKVNADGGRAITSDTYPPGTSAIQAVKDDGNLDNVADKVNIIGSADAVIVALGTNSGNEDLNTQIPVLVNLIRTAKPNVPIFWVNLFYNVKTNVTRDQRNVIIADQASKLGNIRIIDTTSANIQLSSDQTHPTESGIKTFSELIAGSLKSNVGSIPSGDNSEDGFASHVLSYPGITDEDAAANAINTYIQANFPTSPINGLGKFFISGGKKSNVNPFLALGHMSVENGLATAPSGWHKTTPPSYNAFGREANPSTQPYVTYKTSSGRIRTPYKWPSWEASLDGSSTGSDDWFMAIRRNYLNPDGDYYSKTLTEYMSHYAPNSDGNDENSYISKLLKVIDTATAGLTINGVTVGNGCGTSSNPSSGDASNFISDCGANGGNAAIACTAINQLTNIPYDQAQRAAPNDPNPKYLDCSAFTSMAIYRTFGVNVGGICSTDYLTDNHFQEIDVHDVQPGDFVGKGVGCATGGGGGHIAVVVSYDKSKKELVTVEASSKKWPSGVRGGEKGSYPVGLNVDGKGSYIWAVRYVGDKTLQPGAL